MRNFFQVGYVTRDLDRAIEHSQSTFEAGEFSILDIGLDLDTPEGPQSIQLRVGTAWVQALQIELIEPVGGYVVPYAPFLPQDADDFVPRFHHAAVRRDDLNNMRREIEAMDAPIVFETGGNGISSIFVDARRRIGHHLEFVCATPEGWQLLGWPSRSGEFQS